MGNMAGAFVILLGAFIAVVGLRGTHAAVFNSSKYGNLFANTATVSDSTAQAASRAATSSKKPQPVVPGGIILPPITLPGIGTI